MFSEFIKWNIKKTNRSQIKEKDLQYLHEKLLSEKLKNIMLLWLIQNAMSYWHVGAVDELNISTFVLFISNMSGLLNIFFYFSPLLAPINFIVNFSNILIVYKL